MRSPCDIQTGSVAGRLSRSGLDGSETVITA